MQDIGLPASSQQIAYSLRAASLAIGISEAHLRREIHASRLPAKLIGRKYFIGAHELRDWFLSLPDAPDWQSPRRY